MGKSAAAPKRIDRLLAKLAGGDPDQRFRTEIVLGVGVLQVLFFSLVGIIEIAWGTPEVGVICLIGAAAVSPILINLVQGGSTSRTAAWFIAVLYLVSATLNLGSAGQTIGVSVALPSLVLVGTLLLSRKNAIVLFIAVVIQLLVAAWMLRRGLLGPLRPDPRWVQLSIFRVPIVISIITAFVGLFVQRAMVRHRYEIARMHKDLADSGKQLREIIEYSRGLICTHSIGGQLLSGNPAAAQALGYKVTELVGRNIRELVPEERKPDVTDYLERMQANGSDAGAIFLNAHDGELRVWEYNNQLCTDINGLPYILVNATDMTERRQLEEKLRQQNIRDPLTGCFNRRYLALLESRFGADQRWGCVIVDLDNFKQVNDTEGHHRGDEILVAIGNFLNRYAGQRDAVIRMGGEEFLLLLSNGGADIQSFAQSVRHAADGEAPCEITIGYADRSGHESLQQTIDRADRQLYKVRTSKRCQSRLPDS